MAKPVLRYKVNQQSAEVGGRYYGIIEDTPVTAENSILQICEYKKITAFTPEQVLRLVEDVCDGAAKLVARDGQSRQISSLLKFSPRVRGTFTSTDSRWTDQKLIVGARLLKDIKLDIDPSTFVMSNVADIGTLQNAAIPAESESIFDMSVPTTGTEAFYFAVNGSKLQTWDESNTSAALELVGPTDTEPHDLDTVILDKSNGLFTLDQFAPNGFRVKLHRLNTTSPDMTWGEWCRSKMGISSITSARLIIYHPGTDVEFKRLPITA